MKSEFNIKKTWNEGLLGPSAISFFDMSFPFPEGSFMFWNLFAQSTQTFLDHLFILTPFFMTLPDKPWPPSILPRSLQGLFLKIKSKRMDEKKRISAKISPKKQTSNIMRHLMSGETCARLLNAALHLLFLKMLS